MTREEMLARTTKFSTDIVKFCTPLRRRDDCRTIAGQLSDAGTSTAANYRAALRGRSRAEFIAKLGIANEESDESVYWLTTLRDAGLVNTPEMHRLLQEGTELRAIIAASRSTAIKNERKRQRQQRSQKTRTRPRA
jgi:four helix bundle protein